MDILPIRPQIKEGESLSGYLMRSANLLYIDPKDLLKQICYEFNFHYSFSNMVGRHSYYVIAFRLDTLPFRFLNKDGFCYILNKFQEKVEGMTFANIFYKLGYVHDMNPNEYGCVLSNKLVGNFRRFCPKCLNEEGIYKLLWQVREIDICDKHKLRLQDTCPKCKSKQKYYSIELSENRCCKCGEDLGKIKQCEEVRYENIETQLGYYNDWLCMLNPKIIINNPIYGLTNEQSLAAKCMYVAQNQKAYFNSWENDILSKAITRNLAYIFNEKKKKHLVTLNTIFTTVRKKRISLEDFSRVKVPQSYINSLKKKDKVVDRIDANTVCLSPWCKYYGKNLAIKEFDGYSYKRRQRFNQYVCMGCYIVYEFNQVNKCWQTIDSKFFDNITKVKELFLQNMSIGQIAEKLSIHFYLINKIRGYLLNMSLLPDEYKGDSMNIPDNIVEQFRYLLSMKGEIRKLGKLVYGWNSLQYYYYYWLPQVRELFYFDKSILNNRVSNVKVYKNQGTDWNKELEIAIDYLWKNNININQLNICKTGVITLHYYKVNGMEGFVAKVRKLQQYMRRLEYNINMKIQISSYIESINCTRLTLKKLCSDLKISLDNPKNSRVGLKKWIINQIDQYNNKRKFTIQYQHKKQIEDIIVESFKNGIRESIRSISLKLSKGEHYIERSPELLEFTRNIINQYYS
ncbi:TniQ family protein [Clostridium sp. P21]|uniref:TniQ family protein n=1 Tax=Clostridium muellerianum TaxID=2716538 RepID=A0A7Y0HP19_9CLOT|nr:TniQ family protein [Clostridium muellerianum]NMM62238.1 TniQ family protein [Clostridium muellerianum]